MAVRILSGALVKEYETKITEKITEQAIIIPKILTTQIFFIFCFFLAIVNKVLFFYLLVHSTSFNCTIE